MEMRPLSERIVAPADVEMPADADGVQWRAATIDDVDAMLDCHREMDAVDHPHYTTHRDEIADDFSMSHVDPARDTLLALDGSGLVVALGWAIAPPSADKYVSVYAFGGVRPSWRGRGLGRQVVAWQEARALQHFAASDRALPGWLQSWADEVAVAARALLERTGFAPVRYFTGLSRPLADPLAEPAAALDGLVVRSPVDGDEEAMRVARNETFRDHWGSQPRTAEEWARSWRGAVARHDLGSIAVAPDGRIVAFVLASVNPEDAVAAGYSSVYVDLVGTTRDFRGRGIAAALLTRTMRSAAAEGLERADLDVDSESPTGAVGLYTRLGFRPAHRAIALVKEF